MPIWGIITDRREALSQSAAVERMAEALKLGSGSYVRCIGPQGAAGAVSQTGHAHLWCSSELTIVCEADLLNCEELYRECECREEDANVAKLIGRLYGRFGMGLLERLTGSFALAIWDKSHRRLFLAVDRFGIKSISFATSAAGICYASRSRALFASGLIKQEVDQAAIVDYLTFSAIPLPKSAYKGVVRVAPGTFVEWDEKSAAVRRYWDLVYSEDATGSTEELAEQLLGGMEAAVRSASSGVPRSELGCFLSGGTDSSSIVGLLAKAQTPVNTFSIGFAEPRFDELHYAHVAVRHFQTNHREMIPGAEDTYNIIPRVVDEYDEPFANSSAIPAYFCLQLSRKSGIQTMLAGDGGDELFGGNERYSTHQLFELYQSIPAGLRKRVIEPFVFRSARFLWPLKKVGRYISRSNTPNPERYFAWSFFEAFSPREVMPDETVPGRMEDLLAVPRAYYQRACTRSDLNRLLYIDIKMTLGDSDLPKVVGMAELAGVNVRFPYLDHRLAEFTGRLPAKLKVAGLEKRYLFKRATRKLLPAEILKKRKHGFGLPIGMWLRENRLLRGLAEDVLLDPRTYQRGYFRREFIESLFSRMDQHSSPYYGDIVWVLLMLELWHRRHMSGGRA